MSHVVGDQGFSASVRVPVGSVTFDGDLAIPALARGIVLFAHGSGSSRLSPRNRYVADQLNRVGLATLLMDLLTLDEEAVDLQTRQLRFDIGLLAARLVGTVDWLAAQEITRRLRLGLFGSSTGAAAALIAAADRPDGVRAVVSRGGRPDLAAPRLAEVRAPTLLIVGGYDAPVIHMNESALARLTAPARLEIIPRATHLFEEPGALEEVARLAGDWFVAHLTI